MNGYYKGWRAYSGELARTANMPLRSLRAYPAAPSIQAWVPPANRNGGGLVSQCEFDRHAVTGGVHDVQIQQVLEAVNERRAAIALHADHPGYTDAQWGRPGTETEVAWGASTTGIWRPLTWHDITHKSGGGVVANGAEMLDRLRHFITRANSTFPQTGATFEDSFLSAWFIAETDRDVWEPLRRQQTLIAAAQFAGYLVGKPGHPESGWTIVPPGVDTGVYAGTFEVGMQLLGDYPFVKYAEHLNELMYALKMMRYLYPALMFERVQYDIDAWHGNLVVTQSGDVEYGEQSDAAWPGPFSAAHGELDIYGGAAVQSAENPGFVLWGIIIDGSLYLSGTEEEPKVKWVVEGSLSYEVPLQKHSGQWDFLLGKIDGVDIEIPAWHNLLEFGGRPPVTPEVSYDPLGHAQSVVQSPNGGWEFTAARRLMTFDYT